MKQFLNVLKFELGNYFKSKFYGNNNPSGAGSGSSSALPPVFMKGSFSESSAEAREVRKPPEKRRQKAALLMAITIRMQMYWLLQIRTAL